MTLSEVLKSISKAKVMVDRSGRVTVCDVWPGDPVQLPQGELATYRRLRYIDHYTRQESDMIHDAVADRVIGMRSERASGAAEIADAIRQIVLVSLAGLDPKFQRQYKGRRHGKRHEMWDVVGGWGARLADDGAPLPDLPLADVPSSDDEEDVADDLPPGPGPRVLVALSGMLGLPAFRANPTLEHRSAVYLYTALGRHLGPQVQAGDFGQGGPRWREIYERPGGGHVVVPTNVTGVPGPDESPF